MGDIEQWSRTVIAIVGALGALGVGTRYIYRRVVLPVLDNLNAAADIIHHQLQPNGGSSLLDHVNQIPGIKKEVGELKTRIDKFEQTLLATPKEVPDADS